MIEELQMLLSMLGEVSGIAGWVLAGFIVFKLVIYLSTTGAVVFIIKLALNNWYNYGVKKKEPDVIINQWAFADNICISSDQSRNLVEMALSKVVGRTTTIDTSYIHHGDAQWLLDAVNEKIQREEKE